MCSIFQTFFLVLILIGLCQWTSNTLDHPPVGHTIYKRSPKQIRGPPPFILTSSPPPPYPPSSIHPFVQRGNPPHPLTPVGHHKYPPFQQVSIPYGPPPPQFPMHPPVTIPHANPMIPQRPPPRQPVNPHQSPPSPVYQQQPGPQVLPPPPPPPNVFQQRHTEFPIPRSYSTDIGCEFKCLSDGKCLSAKLRCDGLIHCDDGSDENSCSCTDRIESKKMCDGLIDCTEEEDEMHCHGCGENEFSCLDPLEDNSYKIEPSKCIEMTQRCNGVNECGAKNQDEKNCFRLGSTNQDVRGVLSEGLLQKNIGGQWYYICLKKTESEFMLSSIATKVCTLIVGDLNHKEPVTSSLPATTSEYSNLPYAFMGETDSKFQISPNGQCPSKQVFHVKCPEPSCGWPTRKYDDYSPSGRAHRDKRNRYSDNLEDSIQGKVVGGQDSKPGEWPFLGAIYRNGTFHCGCSIIDKEWILTAAHCTHNFDRWVYEVQVGMTRRYSYSAYEQTRQVTQVHTHAKYDKRIFLNDISLMKVDSPFFLSKYVTTACLAYDKTSDPVTNTMCNVIGWGDLTEDGNSPDNLQEVSLPVQPCRETFTREAVQICAGYEAGKKDACQGDSGGPFLCQDSTGRQVVHGLVSFGRGCARPGQLGVYTRVSAYTSWIDSIVSGRNVGPENYYPKSCAEQRCHRAGGECIFPKMRCDRVTDCMHNEDELDCQYEDATSYQPETYHVDVMAVKEAAKEAKHGHEEHTHGEDSGVKVCDETKEFQCKMSKGCVPLQKRCDAHYDCGDYTDEKDCQCGTIVENAYPDKKCDGFSHCLDNSDESSETCDLCHGDLGQIRCPLGVHQCIDRSRWCDGMNQCKFGADEADCFRIVKDTIDAPKDEGAGFLDDKKTRSATSGFVYIRQGGTTWEPACVEDYGENLEDLVCPYLFLDGVAGKYPKSFKRNSHHYVERKLPVLIQSPDIGGRSVDKENKTCSPVRVTCGESSCGVRRLYAYSMGKFKPNSTDIGANPWLTLILIDGQPKCVAILVSKKWVVTSTHCIQDYVKTLKDHYVVVKGGPYHPTMRLANTMEQIKRVNYVDHDFNGLTFLHIDKSFSFDHFVNPVCTKFDDLQTSSTIVLDESSYDETTLHDCFRVGVKEDQVQVTFNKIVVEKDCKFHGGYFCGVSKTKEECLESGNSFVFCTTDHTAITSWYFIGYIGKTDEKSCTVQNDHTIKIEIVNPFVGPLGEKYEEMIENPPPTISSPPLCTGTRCTYGNCVSKSYVCDGINHCSEGEDESRCQRHYQIFRASDTEEENHVSNSHCPSGHFRCESTYNCIPINSFCDGKYDCGMDDLTDEPEGKCDCRHYFELIAPEFICDAEGEVNCPDRTDERDCPCQLGSFNCDDKKNGTGYTCIHPNLVCDGTNDCQNGLDESSCVTLSTNLHTLTENKTSDFMNGFVLLRVRDEWHPYCSNDWSKELATAICRKELDYRKLVEMKLYELEEINSIQRVEEGQSNLMIFQKDEDLFGKYDYTQHGGGQDTNFEECYVAYISCSNDRITL